MGKYNNLCYTGNYSRKISFVKKKFSTLPFLDIVSLGVNYYAESLAVLKIIRKNTNVKKEFIVGGINSLPLNPFSV